MNANCRLGNFPDILSNAVIMILAVNELLGPDTPIRTVLDFAGFIILTKPATCGESVPALLANTLAKPPDNPPLLGIHAK